MCTCIEKLFAQTRRLWFFFGCALFLLTSVLLDHLTSEIFQTPKTQKQQYFIRCDFLTNETSYVIDLILTLARALTIKKVQKSFVTGGEQTLKGTAASFVLTMQTAVGFVRSLYDNENHYRITWGFRTWDQWEGEGRATLGLINGLWRCPSGPLWLFLPALLSTPVLYYPSIIPLLCSPVDGFWKAGRPVVKD